MERGRIKILYVVDRSRLPNDRAFQLPASSVRRVARTSDRHRRSVVATRVPLESVTSDRRSRTRVCRRRTCNDARGTYARRVIIHVVSSRDNGTPHGVLLNRRPQMDHSRSKKRAIVPVRLCNVTSCVRTSLYLFTSLVLSNESSANVTTK